MDSINLEEFYNELTKLEKELNEVNSKVNVDSNITTASYSHFLSKINAYDTDSNNVRATMSGDNNSKKNSTNEESDQDPYYAKIEDPLHKEINDII